MAALANAWDLLTVSCRVEFLVLMLASELILLVAAFYFMLRIPNQHALGVFLPLTSLPLFIGGLRSLLTLAMALSLLQSTADSPADQPDGTMLLGMSAMPLLAGVVIMMPCFTLIASARAYMMWLANRPIPAPKETPPDRAKDRTMVTAEDDANDYLAQLTRGRN